MIASSLMRRPSRWKRRQPELGQAASLDAKRATIPFAALVTTANLNPRVGDTRSPMSVTKRAARTRPTGHTAVSHDGKTMTTTIKGKNADGKAFTATFVFDKQ